MNLTPTALPARHNQEVALIALAVPLIVLGAFFLYFIGQYALIDQHPFQFFADSNTYHDVYSGRILNQGFIDVQYNFLGPLLILSLTGGNIYLVMILNVMIFVSSIIFICRMLDLNPVRAAAVQFLSPLTALSLLSVNKEIIIFPVIALLIASYRSRSIVLVVAAVLVSLLARWQLTVFCVTLVGLYFVRWSNRYVILAMLLVGISIAYFLAKSFLEPVLRVAEASTASYTEGSGLFERLNDIQNDGLYFLVAPIKAAHLLFSLGLRLDVIINPIAVYNDQVQGAFCLVNLLFFVMLLVGRKFSPKSDLITISLVYLIVFALTPIYSPRYFYPVTVLWALVLAGGRGIIPSAMERPIRAVAHV